MTIWTPGSSASNTVLVQIQKTRVTTITLPASGLKPNSSYTFWVNGVDMTWACRTPGSKMGNGLISDANGQMTVLFACEMSRASGNSGTKYHNMSLKDISGKTVVASMLQQTLQ